MPILSKTKTTHCSAKFVHPPALPALRAWDDSCRALVAHRLERSSWFLEFAVHAVLQLLLPGFTKMPLCHDIPESVSTNVTAAQRQILNAPPLVYVLQLLS